MGKSGITKATIDSAKRNAKYHQMEILIADVVKEAVLMARLRRALYDAHIKEGFTPEQALTLCVKMDTK